MRPVDADQLIRQFTAYMNDYAEAGDTRAEQVFADCITELLDARTIDVVIADQIPCGKCSYRDTPTCPAYDAPMRRTSLRIRSCSEGAK